MKIAYLYLFLIYRIEKILPTKTYKFLTTFANEWFLRIFGKLLRNSTSTWIPVKNSIEDIDKIHSKMIFLEYKNMKLQNQIRQMESQLNICQRNNQSSCRQ